MGTLVFFEYIAWHYSGGIREFFAAWRNMYWFWIHFFTVKQIFATFFRPFKGLHDEYPIGLDVQAAASAFIVNTISRIVGVVVRLFFLLIAFAFELGTLIIGIMFFLLYFAGPFFISISIIASIVIITS